MTDDDDVKRRKVDVVLFYGKNGPLGWMSNFSPLPFEEDGKQFKTSEHYIMYRKAVEMGDFVSASAVLEADTPYKAKKLGRKVSPFNDDRWNSIREEVAYRAVYLKTMAHPEVARRLKETGSATLAEASPRDRIWGIGLSAKDPKASDPSKWRGRNLLGEAWTRVRDGLELGEALDRDFSEEKKEEA